jgi:NAD(P)H-hydrate epimerase
MSESRHLLYDPSAVRVIDERAAQSLAVSSLALMERAGAAAYRSLRRRWPAARRICVVCGSGNNAGDGYILARLAHEDGLDVQVLRLAEVESMQGDAAVAAAAFRDGGGTLQAFQADLLASADVLVDAMLGTGLSRALEGEWLAAVAALNAGGQPILALDIPSGLHGGSGAIMGGAVSASATVTFIAYKSGLFTGSGPAVAGELEFAGLGVPEVAFEDVAVQARLIGQSRIAAALPARARDAHKGLYGHVLVVGGDHGMGGAARMAAEAAARVGAGLVSVATRPAHSAGLLAARPELMCHGVEQANELRALLERASVLVLGPGLGRSSWSRALFEAALEFDGPLLIDADGLNLLAERPARNARWVLTPHPGEAARLLETETRHIQQNRFDAAAGIAGRFGGVAVLKGAGTIVQAEGRLPELCTTGNPGMASGGMGDVLSGVIGGLLAQGLEPAEAAAVGVWVHGAAADRAAAQGERGLLAMDLMAHLRELVNSL